MTNHEQHAIAAVFMKLVSRQSDGWHVTSPGAFQPDHIVNDSGTCSSCPSPCYAPRAVELYLERGGSDEVVTTVGVPKAVPVDLLTPPQKALLGVLCSARGLHADDVARRLFGKGLEALTRKQAGRMVERLRKVKEAA
jgi:hypothetical protein